MRKTEIILRTDDCTGCGRCVEACRRGVLRLTGGNSHRVVQIAEAGRCAGCHACERRCPDNAIVIRQTESRKSDPKLLLQNILLLLLALAFALPWSSDAEAWRAVDGWKIFGLFVLFHILFCHLRIPKILKKHNKR